MTGLQKFYPRFKARGVTEENFVDLQLEDYAELGVVDQNDRHKLFRLKQIIKQEMDVVVKSQAAAKHLGNGLSKLAAALNQQQQPGSGVGSGGSGVGAANAAQLARERMFAEAAVANAGYDPSFAPAPVAAAGRPGRGLAAVNAQAAAGRQASNPNLLHPAVAAAEQIDLDLYGDDEFLAPVPPPRGGGGGGAAVAAAASNAGAGRMRGAPGGGGGGAAAAAVMAGMGGMGMGGYGGAVVGAPVSAVSAAPVAGRRAGQVPQQQQVAAQPSYSEEASFVGDDEDEEDDDEDYGDESFIDGYDGVRMHFACLISELNSHFTYCSETSRVAEPRSVPEMTRSPQVVVAVAVAPKSPRSVWWCASVR